MLIVFLVIVGLIAGTVLLIVKLVAKRKTEAAVTYQPAPVGAYPHSQSSQPYMQYPSQAPSGQGTRPEDTANGPAFVGQYPTTPGQVPNLPLQYQAPVVQWVFQPTIPRPASSGPRVASGVLSIALGLWEFFIFCVYVGVRFVNMGLFIAAVGSITMGVIILVKHRRRRMPAPLLLLIFASLGLLAGLSSDPMHTPTLVLTFPLVAATIALVTVVLAKEKSRH
ncbi:hypothetical protein [Specibacter cremeus]|uniref:hypothetical protein n=1 Tax=Specibacter cremeus TaxID=1629051 RepID=UPI000F77374F|nr:hypothetical protein [Specibacter cremeus]